MTKAALILAAILLLAFSASLTDTRPNQVLFDQSDIASLSMRDSRNVTGGSGVSMLVSPDRTSAPASVYGAEDALAPALLVYLALILIGSGIAVGLVWHTYRR